jgi:Holliday junction resolvase RusA-like endonuclease
MRLVIPGVPVPAGRARATVIGGHARVYSPNPTVEYVERIRYAFQQSGEQAFPRDVPLTLEACYWLPRPRSHFGTGRNADRLKDTAPEWHTKKPDYDNLMKLTLDGLRYYAFHDDSQIAEVYGWKRYGEQKAEIQLVPCLTPGLTFGPAVELAA